MKLEIIPAEELETKSKNVVTVGVSVDFDLKTELDKLPTKYKTENTKVFWRKLVEEYNKKKGA